MVRKLYTVCKSTHWKKKGNFIALPVSSRGKKMLRTKSRLTDCNKTHSTDPISPPPNTSLVSPQLRTQFLIFRPILEAVCDLTAMGWAIILYDCLIQARCCLKRPHHSLSQTLLSPPLVDLTRIAILSTCSIRKSGIPIPAAVCDLTAMGWVAVLYNRLLRLGRIQSREAELDVQMNCIRPSDLSEIISTSDTAKVCQGWFLSIQSR